MPMYLCEFWEVLIYLTRLFLYFSKFWTFMEISPNYISAFRKVSNKSKAIKSLFSSDSDLPPA
jgi:hypothetical protein